MKPFNLEEYLANPSRKVVTRDGRDVRIICTDSKSNLSKPIIALVKSKYNDSESLILYTKEGNYYSDYAYSQNDILFTSKKREGWINIYLDADNSSYVGTCIYKSKKESEESGKKWSCYITTLKIKWEE